MLFLHVPKGCIILTKASAAVARSGWDLRKFSQGLLWFNVHTVESPSLSLFAMPRNVVGSQDKGKLGNGILII